MRTTVLPEVHPVDDETTDRDATQALERPATVSTGGSGRGDPGTESDATRDWAGTDARVGPTPVVSDGSPGGGLPAIGRYRIIRRLGQGGFGRVYLARDDDLDRPVAIKVPNPERVAGPEDAEEYLAEARALARLDHPHIVPVHDVGRTEDGLCYVVSKYVEGTDLAERMRQGRMSFEESAELVAAVAEALHHAHTRGLVHRDIKPANILLDTAGKPCVADFGLALRDEDYGKEARLAGTPAYMSPEQARGEGHRVDGRSDIFSLGVVFYELLTGLRPFRGDSHVEVLEQVLRTEERPPRQVDDTIPRELERICQKMLAKRASERYSTARDLADDLRHFLQAECGTAAPGGQFQDSRGRPSHTPASLSPGQPDSDGPVVKVVPKGLRSFDRNDADFFLELLPGPRDRDGLPEGLRFWKTRIESADSDATFKVGLIYGPSGCGKSSLVKAGLLPRLAKHVLPVYIEATPEETEVRLLRGLRKACPDLPADDNLVDSLAALRRGRVLRAGQKVLLVLDQFEQWLFAKRSETDTLLVAALRQCDGERVQAIAMVRDDFWMAATRFMRDLEIRLIAGENSAAVDLFDPLHARKVLAAFGRAYGVLPDRTSDFTPEQPAFLEQSVAGLAQDGKVISVRLALFAEMVKGKPWTPATLREVGGTEGVGLRFLEDTFGASTAPPEHRLHQTAAQAILKALLPRTGTDIKGQMRSEAELREASGYAGRPRDFDDLIHILDPELRLITPTDPEGAARDEGRGVSEQEDATSLSLAPHPSPLAFRYYQLTHDYLVHSLRDWLTRKQRETRRGRAELRLAERAALWNARPENRHLPSAPEWANIRLLTRRKDWTEPQHKMMNKAGWVHGVRGFLVLVLLAAATFAGLAVRDRVHEDRQETRARELVRGLLNADTARVPEIIAGMRGFRRWVDRHLRDAFREAEEGSRQQLHAGLALLPVDPSQADYLSNRLLDANPIELPVIWGILKDHHQARVDRLWTTLEDLQADKDRRFRAACALADSDAAQAEKRWDSVSPFIAERFLAAVIENPADYSPLIETLRPIRRRLLSPLASVFRNTGRSESERTFATTLLADYAADDPDRLSDLLMSADPKAYRVLFPVAERRAEETVPLFQAELEENDWKDPPLDPKWTKPDPTLVGRIESAGGLVDERFAFCQTMPLDEFEATAKALKLSGYRPVRFRPYADGPAAVRVAAVWTRDGRDWHIDSGLTPEQVRQQDDEVRRGTGILPVEAVGHGLDAHATTKYLPVDVAGYVTTADAGPAERYAALWVEASGGDDARLYVGATDDQQTEFQKALDASKLTPRTLHALRGSDGRLRYSGVWGKPPSADVTARGYRDLWEGNFIENQAKLNDQVLLDVAVSEASQPPSIRERARAARERADKTLETKPDALDARLDRALANFRLGDNQKALDDLEVVIGKDPETGAAQRYRVMALARLGKKSDALTELAKYQKGNATESSQLSLAVVVAGELVAGTEKAFESLDAALRKQPKDADLRFDAARAFALASRAFAGKDKDKGRSLAVRALGLLEDLVRSDDADFGRMDDDPDLDPVRDDPKFAAIMKRGHPDRRYAAVWSSEARFEATPRYGLDPAEHLRRGRELVGKGYRPVSWSVTRTTPEGPPVAASVWHRPVVLEEDKDRLAERQARAAVALVRLGKAETVWPLLQHSPDPRLRSFLVNWLNPLGADVAVIVDALALARSGSPDPAVADSVRRGSPDPAVPGPEGLPVSAMDTILFHPETSIRRALILALGTYGYEGLSPGERMRLTDKLLDLFRDDPDAGIHGAAEWTLRRWKQEEKLKAVDSELGKPKDKRDRRWDVNSQGQTFAVIDGPVEFRMGSPANEPDQEPDEIPHRRVIPRRFAIATKEVTVEQYQEFVRENPGVDHASNDRYSPDLKGPMNGVTWYHAAGYCNWLSRKEKRLECYEPNQQGRYAEGMKIRTDALQRTGYRLPTEAEWECACRAGAVTSRYYGLATELLPKYAWNQTNSKDRAWPGGTLLPNDLGLFDMLGNVYEWCQDRAARYQPGRKGEIIDDLEKLVNVDMNVPSLLRGGSFNDLPAIIRSAYGIWYGPSLRFTLNGFRLARTYN